MKAITIRRANAEFIILSSLRYKLPLPDRPLTHCIWFPVYCCHSEEYLHSWIVLHRMFCILPDSCLNPPIREDFAMIGNVFFTSSFVTFLTHSSTSWYCAIPFFPNGEWFPRMGFDFPKKTYRKILYVKGQSLSFCFGAKFSFSWCINLHQ